ncbi:hypothetical protein BpHYR1_005897 [Brachionus plicatilis]|uniref:Uncharacterized protein n=1 Tax=Brachionus plicatilis TaxID=10195 RepID=A0A3M7QLP4_BRAPC|nr:hypothetical protein BpHYR1_005897 [Brachionus plicatilis]
MLYMQFNWETYYKKIKKKFIYICENNKILNFVRSLMGLFEGVLRFFKILVFIAIYIQLSVQPKKFKCLQSLTSHVIWKYFKIDTDNYVCDVKEDDKMSLMLISEKRTNIS